MNASAPVPRALHVSLVALPDAVVSTLAGIYDVMNGAKLMGLVSAAPFEIQIVGETAGAMPLASGVPIQVQQAVDDIDASDIVIVPSLLLRANAWTPGRYAKLVAWLQRMHERGALLCSACSGLFVLAETGLFDGKDATVHFGYARAFAAAFPAVPVHPQRVLVISGLREELISSGASTTWHDLVLYLIARHAGATVAQEVARSFALQWHQDGLSPYIVFEGRSDHGDRKILTKSLLLIAGMILLYLSHKLISNAVQRADYLHVVLVLLAFPLFALGVIALLYVVESHLFTAPPASADPKISALVGDIVP